MFVLHDADGKPVFPNFKASNMKNKTKAEELVNKFYEITKSQEVPLLNALHRNPLEEAKMCALVCVRELMEESYPEYWKQIENEILNIKN
jgi:hypothetical protein